MQAPRARRGIPDPGHPGRGASGPTAIPPRGWWSILRRLVIRWGAHRIMEEAASITFYTLLAIFPAIASVVTLYALFADPRGVEHQLGALSGLIPGGAVHIISGQVHAIVASGRPALGFGLLLSLAVSLWSSAQGVKSLFDALNVVHDVRDRRGFLRFTATALAVTLGALLFVLLALAGVVALPVALGRLGLGDGAGWLLSALRWPVMLAAFALFLACVYRLGPDRRAPSWRWITPGSIAATVLWAAGSVVFSTYVARFGRFNRVYGSLGAGVGMMVWIWISAIVVLMGAELDAAIERQAGRDPGRGGASVRDAPSEEGEEAPS